MSYSQVMTNIEPLETFEIKDYQTDAAVNAIIVACLLAAHFLTCLIVTFCCEVRGKCFKVARIANLVPSAIILIAFTLQIVFVWKMY